MFNIPSFFILFLSNIYNSFIMNLQIVHIILLFYINVYMKIHINIYIKHCHIIIITMKVTYAKSKIF